MKIHTKSNNMKSVATDKAVMRNGPESALCCLCIRIIRYLSLCLVPFLFAAGCASEPPPVSRAAADNSGLADSQAIPISVGCAAGQRMPAGGYCNWEFDNGYVEVKANESRPELDVNLVNLNDTPSDGCSIRHKTSVNAPYSKNILVPHCYSLFYWEGGVLTLGVGGYNDHHDLRDLKQPSELLKELHRQMERSVVRMSYREGTWIVLHAPASHDGP